MGVRYFLKPSTIQKHQNNIIHIHLCLKCYWKILDGVMIVAVPIILLNMMKSETLLPAQ